MGPLAIDAAVGTGNGSPDIRALTAQAHPQIVPDVPFALRTEAVGAVPPVSSYADRVQCLGPDTMRGFHMGIATDHARLVRGQQGIGPFLPLVGVDGPVVQEWVAADFEPDTHGGIQHLREFAHPGQLLLPCKHPKPLSDLSGSGIDVVGANPIFCRALGVDKPCYASRGVSFTSYGLPVKGLTP